MCFHPFASLKTSSLSCMRTLLKMSCVPSIHHTLLCLTASEPMADGDVAAGAGSGGSDIPGRETVLLPLVAVEDNTVHMKAYEGQTEALRRAIEETPTCAVALDADRRTPLQWAVSGGHEDCVDLLLPLTRAKIDSKDEGGWTVLHIASSAGQLRIASKLLQSGADASVLDKRGFTPLHRCKGSAEMIMLLAEHMDTVDVSSNTGVTPLIRASLSNQLLAVRALLELGANVSMSDRSGNTPLHHACLCGFVEVGVELVRHSAGLRVRNREGKTAISLASNSMKGALQSALAADL